MILENKYKQAMDHVEVDDAMKARILAHIQNENLSNEKTKTFPFWKRWIPAFACLLVVGILSGVMYLKQLNSSSENEQNTMIVNPITAVEDLDELNEICGFGNKEIENLPFEVTRVDYICYVSGEEEIHLAEITYYGENDELIYRKSKGEEDNSGRYDTYLDNVTEILFDTEVLLRGENGMYKLVTWSKDGYSYSLYDENGLDASRWKTILESQMN